MQPREFIRGVAFSIMGAKPHELHYYSMQDVWAAYAVSQNLEDKKQERLFKLMWEQSRMESYYSHRGHVKQLDIRDIVWLPWLDGEMPKGTTNNPWTKEEIEKLKAQGHPLFN